MPEGVPKKVEGKQAPTAIPKKQDMKPESEKLADAQKKGQKQISAKKIDYILPSDRWRPVGEGLKQNDSRKTDKRIEEKIFDLDSNTLNVLKKLGFSIEGKTIKHDSLANVKLNFGDEAVNIITGSVKGILNNHIFLKIELKNGNQETIEIKPGSVKINGKEALFYDTETLSDLLDANRILRELQKEYGKDKDGNYYIDIRLSCADRGMPILGWDPETQANRFLVRIGTELYDKFPSFPTEFTIHKGKIHPEPDRYNIESVPKEQDIDEFYKPISVDEFKKRLDQIFKELKLTKGNLKNKP